MAARSPIRNRRQSWTVGMRRSARLIATLLCGLVVAVAADAVLSVATSEEIAIGATLLLVMVTTLSFAWASR